ncbi:MAG: hypothetical protein WBN51_04330, partial [Gammaproteobacteria bacterium]
QQQRIRHGEIISVSGTATGGREAAIWQGNRKLASAPVSAGRWQLQIDSQILGVGPVALGVRVVFDDNTVVRSVPLKIDITPPEFTRLAPGNHRLDPGNIEDTGTEDNHKAANRVILNGKLRNLTDVQHLTMAGQFTVARSGFFELVVTGAGEISLAVDARPLMSNHTMDSKQTRFFPLALEHGPHDLKIEFSPADKQPRLKLILEGDQVATMPEVNVVREVRVQTNATP